MSSERANDYTHRAIAIMTAWLEGGDRVDFRDEVIGDYLDDGPDAEFMLIDGLTNLAALLLKKLSQQTGKDASVILQDCARQLN